jgi:hypothetical protein
MAGPYELQSPKDIAMEYGGNKQKIAQAAQMGLIDPTAAVMAGMFIDRMRNAQKEEMVPQTTVANDVMATPQMAAGLGATPQAAMAPTEAGIAALPLPDDMVPNEYAGGGIVAFANGGDPAMFGDLGGGRMPDQNVLRAYQAASGARMPRKELVNLMTLPELQEYNRTGKIPARLSQQVQGRAIEGVPMFGSGIYSEMGMEPTPTVVPVPVPVPVSKPKSGGEDNYIDTEKDDVPNYGSRNLRSPGASSYRGPAQLPENVRSDVAPAQTDPLSGFSAYQAMLEAAGVPKDPFAEDRAAAKTRQEELVAQRTQDKGMALLAAGLAGMNTRNLAEFAQKAGEVGIGVYGQSRKEAREEQREIDKINRDIRKAEVALKRGDVEKYMDFKDKAEARRIQIMGVEAQRAAAGKPGAQTELIAAYAKAKNIPFDQALREVAAAQAEGKDPLLGMIQSRLAGGSNISAQLADLMKKYPDAFK